MYAGRPSAARPRPRRLTRRPVEPRDRDGISLSFTDQRAPLLIAGPRPRDEVEPRERNGLPRSLAPPAPLGIPVCPPERAVDLVQLLRRPRRERPLDLCVVGVGPLVRRVGGKRR